MIEVDSHHHFWKKINVLNNLLKFKIQQERTIKIVRKETEYLNNKIKSLEKKLAILNFKYNEIVDNSTNLKNFIIRQNYINNENRYERYYLWVIISLLLIGISNLYYHIIMSY